MKSIQDLLNSETGKKLIDGASAQTGESTENISKVLQLAMPAILGGMQRNASTPEGAQNLNKALEDKQHQDASLGFLGNLLGGNQSELLENGAGILGHVFGGNQKGIEKNISKASGVDASSVSQIIKMAAPFVMNLLASNKKESGAQGGIGDLLTSVMGSQGGTESLIESLLDGKDSGNVIGNLAGKFLGKKKGGLGGLFG